MRPWHAVGMFCEDVRDEKDGVHTLIGILPDNMNVQKVPGMFPKLGLYVRIHADPKAELGTIAAKLRFPDGTESELGKFDAESVKKAQADSEMKGSPITGFMLTAVASPVNLKATGRILLIVAVAGEEVICAGLNIQETAQS